MPSNAEQCRLGNKLRDQLNAQEVRENKTADAPAYRHFIQRRFAVRGVGIAAWQTRQLVVSDMSRLDAELMQRIFLRTRMPSPSLLDVAGFW